MKKGKKIILVTLLVALLSISFLTYIDADSSKLSDYQKELEEIKRQQKATAEKLTGIEKEIAQDIYEMTDLDSKVIQYTNELNEIQAKVDEVNEKLKSHEEALQNSAQLYNSAEEIYTTRLRAIYENGLPSMVDILLKSEGISDFFSKMNVYQSILDYDKSLVSNIQNQKEYIDYIKKDIEVQKLQLDQLKYDVQKSTDTLEKARQAKENKVNQLRNSKEKLQAFGEELAKQKAQADKKIDEEVEKIRKEQEANGGNGQVFSGQFTWPTPGYYIITTRYGTSYDPWDTGKYTVHTGCDIAGTAINGKPIHALEAGTVTLARWNGGYGNCVMINHGTSAVDGNSYISLYGHASSLAVKQGQKVERGQVIAYVGSTGNSTGPHLHLELFKNGKRLDPLSYFKDLKLVYR